MTCPNFIKSTSFKSNVTGHCFDGVYEFDKDEPHVLSCKSVNVIYLLECNQCKCQYIGETIQELHNRISGHRSCTRNMSGNFRMRQHFSGFQDSCQNFSIKIVRKLLGTGRTDELLGKSFKMNSEMTRIRKAEEDNLIMNLYTMFPYGMNDRIDSLEGKSKLNCVFAMFRSIGYKGSRKRTWKKTKSLADESILKSKAIEFDRLLNQGFLVSQVGPIFDYLFHIPKNSIIYLRDLYFKLVISDNFENDVTFYQLHYILCDLFMYKI